MNKRVKLVVTIIIIVFLAGVIFYPKYKPFIAGKMKGGMEGPGPSRQQQQKLNVVGYVLVPTDMSDLINQTATLLPDEEVNLSFETSGKIVNINFIEGARVKKGDLLAKMNDKPLQAQLEKLEVQLKMAESKEFRQRSLLDKDAISQESYDQIQTDVQSIKADINLIKARISETELRAPFDGIIGVRDVSEGHFATSSTRITKLVKIKPLKIQFSISEKYTSEIKIGYPITFTAGLNEVFNASVYAIEPKIDLDTRTIVIRALYPNTNEELKPGRYSWVSLELSKKEGAISIPTEAVLAEMEGEKVFVYRNGKAKSAKITIGLRTASKVEITNGLKIGDTLLTTGMMQLRENLPVTLDTIILNK